MLLKTPPIGNALKNKLIDQLTILNLNLGSFFFLSDISNAKQRIQTLVIDNILFLPFLTLFIHHLNPNIIYSGQNIP
ncbi:hypothetical protein FRX31_003216 [Thalictrum thalictroides]|uniref:Uncharacterized protein n=1 Tax=Thalictrum thalictroides TaxID=46969 RepID=A0A7J6XEA5_THATH|nr:hypothetical protein FRX31_003216 [Thalictrum thalictroides]